MSPFAKASTTVVGMMFRMNSVAVILVDGFAPNAATALTSRVAGSTLNPSPGRKMSATARPISKARVEAISKKMSARTPMRPASLRLDILHSPPTTVTKMIGAMIILMSLMKPSPSGFIALPASG